MAPVFCIILSASSLSTSSGVLPFSPESPAWPLFLLQPDPGGSEKERRMEQEGWEVMKNLLDASPSSLFSFVWIISFHSWANSGRKFSLKRWESSNSSLSEEICLKAGPKFPRRLKCCISLYEWLLCGRKSQEVALLFIEFWSSCAYSTVLGEVLHWAWAGSKQVAMKNGKTQILVTMS